MNILNKEIGIKPVYDDQDLWRVEFPEYSSVDGNGGLSEKTKSITPTTKTIIALGATLAAIGLLVIVIKKIASK